MYALSQSGIGQLEDNSGGFVDFSSGAIVIGAIALLILIFSGSGPTYEIDGAKKKRKVKRSHGSTRTVYRKARGSSSSAAPSSDLEADVVDALVSQGSTRAQAKRMVSRATGNNFSDLFKSAVRQRA